MKQFILIGENIVNIDTIDRIDFSDIEKLRIVVYLKHSSKHGLIVVGIQVIDILMTIKPSALEGRRMRWNRHAWSIHNLVGHPLMQVLAYLKYYKLAMKVHDLTVPRPIDSKLYDSFEARRS